MSGFNSVTRVMGDGDLRRSERVRQREISDTNTEDEIGRRAGPLYSTQNTMLGVTPGVAEGATETSSQHAGSTSVGRSSLLAL